MSMEIQLRDVEGFKINNLKNFEYFEKIFENDVNKQNIKHFCRLREF